MRLHTERLPDALVAHTRLPRTLVNVTLRRLKEAERISRGFRHAPPLTPKDVARIILGLSAMSPTQAVAHERAVGRLPLASGETAAETAEAALTGLIEVCAGIRAPAIHLGTGAIVIGQTRPSLEIRSQRPGGAPISILYGLPGSPGDATGASALFTIPIPTIRAIAREIMRDIDNV